jgi:5-deoxy-glucuronate isomerase
MNPLASRYRNTHGPGLNSILQQNDGLSIDTVFGHSGDRITITFQSKECAVILIKGEAVIRIEEQESILMGPRPNPFDHLPHAVLLSGDKSVAMTFQDESIVLIATSPSETTHPTQVVQPRDVRVYDRGRDNWSRNVRLVCWSDNTEGEWLLVGETVSRSGNWSSFPPHRHEFYREGTDGPEEVPYEEAYFFQFTRPEGFGIVRHFDEGQKQDDALVIRTNDLLHIRGGYHPVVCAPGSDLYHLTIMAGPFRISAADVHPAYRYVLSQGLQNPFRNQESAT